MMSTMIEQLRSSIRNGLNDAENFCWEAVGFIGDSNQMGVGTGQPILI
jgi:hypothetical protein